ncbi:TetR/AcrR family transcriptional regulator [Cellulomonas sp. SLBN-39]|uniref:TetR/AcrR family transcriptional regulator n=1 Tax=Cellulomonas sp. SLBN-39 TaxID=2768446 RepID=UPI00114D9AE0|nr:TetR/AcrR family transcriptional regulator [Cellulomonas sp. SLBN-39]TQL03766.1 TetR family transcriptional regulator [Cellulomonas sp. SLBN-39]
MTRRDARPRRRLDPQERREALLTAAADVFAGQGYAAATMGAVAAAADASEALVYRYFAGKDELYAAVLAREVDALVAAEERALSALHPGVPVRDRVRAVVLTRLDRAAADPDAWLRHVRHPAAEPVAAGVVRARAHTERVARVGALLVPRADARHAYAVPGWLAFVDAACERWAEQGCPPDDRWPLVEACLGALEGALGDWG